MIRSSVVLPEPDGPSSATSRPRGISRSTSSSAVKLPNRLVMSRTVMLMGVTSETFPARHSTTLLTTNVASAKQRQQRSDGERRDELIIVVKHFDLQRHRIGQAADVARNDRHRAELAHRARVAENHAVEQRPLDVRKRDAARTSAIRSRRGSRRLLPRRCPARPSAEAARAQRKATSRKSSPRRCPEPRR